MRIEIYTDGACSNNGSEFAPGGWAAILRALKSNNGNKEVVHEKVIHGHKVGTTNNEMELIAILEALRCIKSGEGMSIQLYSDSRYCIDAVTKWAEGWKKKGWVTTTKTPVKNKELIEGIYTLYQTLGVEFHWVKGHASNPTNNKVDEIAVRERILAEQEASGRPASSPQPMTPKTKKLVLTEKAAKILVIQLGARIDALNEVMVKAAERQDADHIRAITEVQEVLRDINNQLIGGRP